MRKFNLLVMVLFIVLIEIIGSIGSLFTIPAIPSWYATINKSPITPPNWVFGPVWTTLFLLMGISAYIIWRYKDNKLTKTALTIFLIQFIFNVIWSILFFGLKNPLLSFVEIILLWISILLTIIYFIKINKLAGFLLIPYIFWVSLASYLNLMVYLLNK